MGSEEIFNQFVRLEEKIETLINKCVKLDKENIELKEKIFELENEILDKEEVEIERTKDSENLKSRIDNILEKISEFDTISE